MARATSSSASPTRLGVPVPRPLVRRGADDQAAAYEAWLAQWADMDPDENEREWQLVRNRLQQTRRELGQRLLFAE